MRNIVHGGRDISSPRWKH